MINKGLFNSDVASLGTFVTILKRCFDNDSIFVVLFGYDVAMIKLNLHKQCCKNGIVKRDVRGGSLSYLLIYIYIYTNLCVVYLRN